MPLCRPEATEGLEEQAASSSDFRDGSDKVEEQSTQGSLSKQDAAAAPTDSTAASHDSSPSLPPNSGAAEADASHSVGTTFATTPAATSGPSSPHASNSQPDDSTLAEPPTAEESAVADVQQGDSVYGGNGSQQSQSDQATSPETASSPVERPGMSAGGNGSNGEHGDDDARSVRSQDTTTSRASKIQASEMTRLQVRLAASIKFNLQHFDSAFIYTNAFDVGPVVRDLFQVLVMSYCLPEYRLPFWSCDHQYALQMLHRSCQCLIIR